MSRALLTSGRLSAMRVSVLIDFLAISMSTSVA